MRHSLSALFLSICMSVALPTGAHAQESPVDPATSWDLTDLFPNVDAWNAERERLLGEFSKIAAYKGSLGNSSDDLQKTLRFVSDTYRQVLRVYVYASLQQDEDLRVTEAQERNQLAEAMYASFSQATAWIDPEIIAVGETRIRQFMSDNPDLAPFVTSWTTRCAPQNTHSVRKRNRRCPTSRNPSMHLRPFTASSAIPIFRFRQ